MGRITLKQIIRRIKWYLFQNNPKLIRLQHQLGYFFNRKALLNQAITHKSADSNSRNNYERLEFLGDAILDNIVSKLLIHEFPDGDEGFLTQKRSALVQKSFLAKMGRKLNLLEYINAGPSLNLMTEKVSQNQLANIFEAVVGAIYLDEGMSPCEQFIKTHLWNHRHKSWKTTNYKGMLIEYCHSSHLETPQFITTKIEGPEHEKIFEVKVKIGNQHFPSGIGTNKKAAEQEAAFLTLSMLNY